MVYRHLTAGERIEFGVPVKVVDSKVVQANVQDMEGIATRPHNAGAARAYAPGLPCQFQTEGHILGLIEGSNKWCELRAGKLVN